MSLASVNALIDAGFPDNNNREGTAQKLRDVLKLTTGHAQEAIDVSEEAIDLFNEVLDPARNSAVQAAASAAAAAGLVLGGSTSLASIKSSLSLDLTGEVLDPKIAYARTGPRTHFGPRGIMRIARDNEWPRDFHPITGENLGRTPWEGSTNWALYSEDISNVFYAKSRGDVTINNGIDLMGGTAADLLTCTETSTGGMFLTSVTLANTAIVGTVSVHIRKGALNHASLVICNAGITSAVRQWFNLANLTTASSTVFGTGYIKTDAKITDCGNGYVRISLSAAIPAEAVRFIIAPAVPGDLSVASVLGDSVHVWGVQYEPKAFVSPYMPATTAPVIRTSEEPKLTGTNFSDWYNPNEGTFFVSTFSPVLAGAVRRSVAVTDGTSNNSLQLSIYGPNQVYFEGKFLGGLVLSSLIGPTIPVGSALRKVLSYKKDNFFGVANGFTVSDTSGDIPVVNQLNIGHYTTFGHFNAPIKQITYWPKQLKNVQSIEETIDTRLTGKEPNQLPTNGALQSGAFTPVPVILAMRGRQEIPILGTGTSQTYTLRWPYDFMFGTVNVPTGTTISSSPSTTVALSANTNYTLTITVPVNTFFVFSINPIY
jgi:hypothetical protein